MSERGYITDVLPSSLRRWAGGAAAALALVGPLTTANASGTAKSAARTPSTYMQPDQLPGYGIGVSQVAERELADSTVAIDYQIPDNEDDFASTQATPVCTGVEVHKDGQIFTSLAAHCLKRITNNEYGLLPAKEYPQAPALDFVQLSPFKYTLEDPRVPSQDQQPLATATGISISTRSTDVALLKVAPEIPTNSTTGQPARDYEELKSMPYSSNINLIPGQEVALSGVPQSSNYELVSETGIYLGMVTDHSKMGNATSTQQFDVVLTHPGQPYDDAGYYGSSGGSFVADEQTPFRVPNGKHYKVVISGPLARRINTKYDPYLVPFGDFPTQEATLKYDLSVERAEREDVEKQLDVAVSPNATLLLYTVIKNPVQTALMDAFGNFAPPLAPVTNPVPANG